MPQRDYKMSADARGYLMANNLNYATFDSMKATSYQHCLTQENLNIVESMAKVALNHRNQPGVKEYSNQLCGLAIASQQLNQSSPSRASPRHASNRKFKMRLLLPI